MDKRWLIRIIFNIAILFFISRVLLLLVAVVYNEFTGSDKNIFFLLEHWDSYWYEFIVSSGYSSVPALHPGHSGGDFANWAFFPLYPMMVRLFWMLSGKQLDIHFIGVILSNIFIFLTAIIAFFYYKETRKVENYTIPFLLFFAPYTIYFSCCYTESLFILLVALCFYFARKHHYMMAGIVSALASATRSIGVLLVFVVIIEMYMEKYDRLKVCHILDFIKTTLLSPLKMLSILICPLGFFCFMLLLYFRTGDAWAMAHVQIAWNRISENPFITLAKGLVNYNSYTIIKSILCISALVLGVWLIVKRKVAEGVFLMISLLIPLASSLMSTPRFIAGSLIAELGAADIIRKHEGYRNLVFAVCIFIEFFLVLFWYHGNGIMV